MANEQPERQIRELNQQVAERRDHGKYEEALDLAREVCELARRVLGSDHADTARSVSNLGDLLLEMGHLTAARPYLEEALDVRRRVLGEQHPETGTSLGNLGSLLWRMGDLAAARRYYEQALEIHSRVLGRDHPSTATSLNNLGTLLRYMGDMAGARWYLELALAIRRRVLGQQHPDTGASLGNLGGLLRRIGDLPRAQLCYEGALEIRRRVLGGEHPDTARSLSNLGDLLRDKGALAGARPYYEEALEIRRRVLGDNHPSTASSLNNLGNLMRDIGELAAARPLLAQALEIHRRLQGDHHLQTAKSLNYLGSLDVALGRIDEAMALLRQATAIADRVIGQVFSVGSDQQRLFFLRQLHSRQAGLLSLVNRHLSHSPEAVRMAFDLVVRRKALGAEALAAQRDAILGGRFPHLREAFEQLTQLRRRIAQKTLSGPASGETLAAHEQTLHQWWQEQQQRETELARQIPEVNLEQHLRKADRRAVALGLDEGVALVEFVRFDVFDFHAVPARGERRWQPARYLAFALPAGQPEQVQMIDLGEAGPIDRMIADFRDSVAVDPRDRPDRDIRRRKPESPLAGPGQVGPELRAAVFDKLVPALGGCNRLLLAPDGDLARLPFEVLADAEGRILLEQYRISYLSCARDVLRFGAEPTRPADEPLVVADPLFDLTADARPPGPGAATPSRCSRDFKRSDYHFPRLPGTREEGEQVAGLLGVRTGEGVFGLRRAFVVAGARSLVMSLWKVPDEQTRELMIDFYRRVLSGQGVADALRQAQLAMREKHPDPYYWGAFICQGNPGPLTSVGRAHG